MISGSVGGVFLWDGDEVHSDLGRGGGLSSSYLMSAVLFEIQNPNLNEKHRFPGLELSSGGCLSSVWGGRCFRRCNLLLYQMIQLQENTLDFCLSLFIHFLSSRLNGK